MRIAVIKSKYRVQIDVELEIRVAVFSLILDLMRCVVNNRFHSFHYLRLFKDMIIQGLYLLTFYKNLVILKHVSIIFFQMYFRTRGAVENPGTLRGYHELKKFGNHCNNPSVLNPQQFQNINHG